MIDPLVGFKHSDPQKIIGNKKLNQTRAEQRLQRLVLFKIRRLTFNSNFTSRVCHVTKDSDCFKSSTSFTLKFWFISW